MRHSIITQLAFDLWLHAVEAGDTSGLHVIVLSSVERLSIVLKY